ncbi:hypothetical protein CRUP_036812 [Coryphaenoides rupestris]|nr:hypothetical protein CRUP_036812 [Coryphaenoides rupestris]
MSTICSSYSCSKIAILVGVFGVCWAPFHTERLLWSSISQWTDTMHAVYQCVHILAGVLFYLSSAVNPIIYNLLSTRFREGFRELVCRAPARDARGDSIGSGRLPATPQDSTTTATTAAGSAGGGRDKFLPLLLAPHDAVLGVDGGTLGRCTCREAECMTSVF